MGRAGKALEYVLTQYGIRHRRLAITMRVERSLITNWVDEVSEPSIDSLSEILLALETLEPGSSSVFKRKYLELDSE